MDRLFSYGVVLTGSIATGKSSVANFLKKDNFVVIDADHIAHTVLEEEQQQVVEVFGKTILNHTHTIDRALLGQKVFASQTKREALQAILHPKIFDKIAFEAKKNDALKKLYFIDIPLFFETNNYEIDTILVVYTPFEKQLSRLMKRNAYSKEEALKRIKTQIPIEEKAQKATYIIDNSATLLALEKSYQEVITQMVDDFKTKRKK